MEKNKKSFLKILKTFSDDEIYIVLSERISSKTTQEQSNLKSIFENLLLDLESK